MFKRRKAINVADVLPSGRRLLAPSPTQERVFPWRFVVGQRAYVYGAPGVNVMPASDSELKVIGGELHNGWPHLFLEDVWGVCWRVPQIHVSPNVVSLK